MSNIYVIEIDQGTLPKVNRLVKAGNAARATRHVAREMFAVRLATQEDLVEMVAAGIKVEQASEMI